MKRKQRRWYLVPVAFVESTLTHMHAETHTHTLTPHIDFGLLAHYLMPIVSKLDFRMDLDFK